MPVSVEGSLQVLLDFDSLLIGGHGIGRIAGDLAGDDDVFLLLLSQTIGVTDGNGRGEVPVATGGRVLTIKVIAESLG